MSIKAKNICVNFYKNEIIKSKSGAYISKLNKYNISGYKTMIILFLFFHIIGVKIIMIKKTTIKKTSLAYKALCAKIAKKFDIFFVS